MHASMLKGELEKRNKFSTNRDHEPILHCEDQQSIQRILICCLAIQADKKREEMTYKETTMQT